MCIMIYEHMYHVLTNYRVLQSGLHIYVFQHKRVYTHLYIFRCICCFQCICWYEVASISRFLKITGLFCKRALQKKQYSTKENYSFEEHTNRSHPIHSYICKFTYMIQYTTCVQGSEDPYDALSL